MKSKPKDYKKREYATKYRMKFESGYKKFDRRVDFISTGNVVSNVQYSSIIRTFSDTDKGKFKPGQCREFDINNFARKIPFEIMKWLDENREEKVWLYNFHFRNTNSERGENIGWILTDYKHEKVIMSSCFSGWIEGRGSIGHKRKAVLDEATKYIVKGNWEDEG